MMAKLKLKLERPRSREVLVISNGRLSEAESSDDDIPLSSLYATARKTIYRNRRVIADGTSDESDTDGVFQGGSRSRVVQMADYLESTPDESEEPSEDDQPSTSNAANATNATVPKNAKAAAPKFDCRWRNREPDHVDTTFKGQPISADPARASFNALDYFRQLFTVDMVSIIVEETNKYSVQCTGKSIGVTLSEIEQYLGILLIMSVTNYPSYRMYWDDQTRLPIVADAISRNRFEEIKRFIHFNDNMNLAPGQATPPLFKVAPILQALQDRCLMITPEAHQFVGNQMIPYREKRSGAQQCSPKEQIKWGFKVLTRSSPSGMMHDFFIYTGKDSTTKFTGHSAADAVVTLCSSLPENMNYKICFDNWFASIDLVRYLADRGFHSVCTIRSNRLNGCTMKTEKQLAEEGQGSYDRRVEANTNIRAVIWYDSKPVRFLSSYCDVEPIQTVRRWSKTEKAHKEVPCPAVALEYNHFMGGVDLSDMLISLCRLNHGSKKYYMRIFAWALSVSCVNAWLLSRRDRQNLPAGTTIVQAKCHLREFVMAIGVQLVQYCKNLATPSRLVHATIRPRLFVKRPRRRQIAPLDSIRHDQLGHWPSGAAVNDSQRCKRCIAGKTRIFCVKCNVFLCLTRDRNCFYAFHTVRQ